MGGAGDTATDAGCAAGSATTMPAAMRLPAAALCDPAAQVVVEDPDLLPPLRLRPVGVVHSPFRSHLATPRQPATGADEADGIIVLRRGLQNLLCDLKGFDRIWVVFQFCYARGWKDLVRPPRSPVKRGLFATRCPHRPNPIGLSAVRLLNVVGRKVFIRDHNLLHGTPVLDLKPYLPYCDAHPDARAGWVDTVDPAAPDHRWV